MHGAANQETQRPGSCVPDRVGARSLRRPRDGTVTADLSFRSVSRRCTVEAVWDWLTSDPMSRGER